MTPEMGMILFVGSVLLIAIGKTNEHLRAIANLLARANEQRDDMRNGDS